MEPTTRDPLEDYLTSEQVAEELGVPYRSLLRWVNEGLLKPRQIGSHSKAVKLWSPKELREARVIAKLRRENVSMQDVRRAMETLRAQGHNPFSTGKFLVLSHGAEVVKVCEGDGELISCLREPGQRLLRVIDLEDIPD